MEVFLQGFGVVGEVAVDLLVEELIGDAEPVEQFGQHESADAVDAVYADAELLAGYGIGVDELEVEDGLHVAVVEAVVDGNLAQLVDVGIVEVFLLGQVEHLLAFGGIEELALAVEQLQGIPLTGIV